MGIYCEINLIKTANDSYRPGDDVSGIIKYALDKETTFNKITVSLRGKGKLHVKKKSKDSDGKDNDSNYSRIEDYVNIQSVVTETGQKLTLPIGSNEVRFKFELPRDIPPSFLFKKYQTDYEYDCEIVYYISIKFEIPGMFNWNKSFKKEINVVRDLVIEPNLPTEPCIFGERKTLTQIFRLTPSVVNLKVTVNNSVVEPDKRIMFTYELSNDTNVTITKMKARLIESHNFYISDDPYEVDDPVIGTKWRIGELKRGLSQKGSVEINVPSDVKGTFEKCSKLVRRVYYVHFVVGLPLPHRDLQLKVPVQIGWTRINRDNPQTSASTSYPDEPPPSYWEAMGEV